MTIVLYAYSSQAGRPEYFTDEIDKEYRALAYHMRDLLPKSDLPLAYLPSLGPFNLMDVRPTNIDNVEHKQAFANFNFGFFAAGFLNVERKILTQVTGSSICTKRKCTRQRITAIEAFIAEASDALKQLNDNESIFIVQQTDASVYRVNNTFYTPTTLLTYFPSEQAGFVPSAQFEMTPVEQSTPELIMNSKYSEQLRLIMGKHNVAAIAKIDELTTNIIFGGFGDNHWGVVVGPSVKPAKVGDYNHIGLQYERVKALSDMGFYYQTN
jgi:hypothetical protein